MTHRMLRWLASQWWIPINTVGPCIGLTVFRWFRWKVELWYAPADYSTPEHTHEDSDGEFLVLHGRGRWIWRRPQLPWEDAPEVLMRQAYRLKGGFRWKWLTVKAGTPHGFERGETPMIWLCVEHWKPGVKVTSVATDFVLT